MLVAVTFLAVSIAFLDTIIKLLFSDGSNIAVETIKDSPFGFLQSLHKQIALIIAEKGKAAALGTSILIIVSMNVVGNGFKYLAQFFMNFVRTKVIEDIRHETFSKISKLQIAYFEGKRKGDIMTRLTSDLLLIESSIVITLESLIRDPITIIAFIFLMLKSSPQLTLIIFILLPVTAIIIAQIGKSLRKDSQKTQEKLSWLTSVIDEFTSGIRIIKAFNAENYINKIFGTYNKKYSYHSRMAQNKQRSIPLISESLGVVTMGIFLLIGGKMVIDGQLQQSLLFTFIFFFQQIMQPAKKISSAYSSIMKGIVSGERLFGLMDSPLLIKDKENPIAVTDFKSDISFEDVSFAYSKEKVLKNINFKIPKGKIYAIVGKSGSGKTTLVELILRFYDVSSGEITLDGTDIRDIKLFDLRNLNAIVTQDPILFNDNIHNNISFGIKSSKEDVIKAAKAANAHDFIMETENGYQTFIGDRGTLLSGGQRQRLSIARAILRNPPILLLDEATSSLDTSSENLVQDALNKLMKKRTSIVIAHRLSTIQNADKIIVLEKGEIVETGTHKKLISQEGAYKKLYDLQQLTSNKKGNE